MDDGCLESLEEWLETELGTPDDSAQDLRLPEGLLLPVRLKWIVNNGSNVVKGQVLAVFTPLITGKDEASDRAPVSSDDNLILRSVCDGRIHRYMDDMSIISEVGAIIGEVRPNECKHEVVIHDLCASCFLNVTNENFCSSGKRRREICDYQDGGEASKEKIIPGFITNDNDIRVDASLAHDMEYGELYRLLRDRKLCLVLDLDNTLVHATSHKHPDDILIEEIDFLGKDGELREKGAQYASEEDEEMIKLQEKLENSILITNVYNGPEMGFCKSYFKLRPGVFRFLREATRNFELYLFTMGTKSHATVALSILDPKNRFFGNRIFSRGDANSYYKSLDRIFPRYKHLMLVMDDSEYAWNSSLGLIKVHPYFFFADLNVLTSRDARSLTRLSAALQSPCVYSNFVWHLLMSDLDNKKSKLSEDEEGFSIPNPISKKFEYNSLLIANERPTTIYNCQDSNLANSHGFKKIYVRDSDSQLRVMTKLIKRIHRLYFERLDELLPVSKEELTVDVVKDMLQNQLLPEAGQILQGIRYGLLDNVCLYANPSDFLCPGSNEQFDFLRDSDFGHWAVKFGAKIASIYNDSVTHYLCNNKSSTMKLGENVKSVHIKWLEAVFYTWSLPDESNFDVQSWSEPVRSFWDIINCE